LRLFFFKEIKKKIRSRNGGNWRAVKMKLPESDGEERERSARRRIFHLKEEALSFVVLSIAAFCFSQNGL